jgi:hypothetical protein
MTIIQYIVAIPLALLFWWLATDKDQKEDDTMGSYEVVKARTADEAIEKSKWHVGQRAVCTQIEAIANGDGTYSVMPVFEVVESEKRRTGHPCPAGEETLVD